MTSTELFSWARQFWRVPVIGLLAGVLAFGGSFLIGSKYEASTQLLVRGRDTTLLSGTGEGLRDQPAIIDAALTTALSETQSALLSSRAVAERVVESLQLDQPRPADQSLMARLRRGVKGMFIRAKAYLTYGFYAEPDPYERAVGDVYEGLDARPRRDSYVIELTATARSPELSAAIANAAADALVDVSRDRFQQDARTYRDFLGVQVERSAEEERSAAQAVRAYKDEHDITDVGLAQELDTRAQEELRLDLQNTNVELAAARAELGVINQSLGQVGSTASSQSRISTGRSSTQISGTQANPAYQDLLVQRELIEARVASLEARQEELGGTLSPAPGASLTEEEAQLRQLELQYSVASDSYRELSARYQQAVINAENEIVEIIRIDTASAPLFPSSPKRYLFLGLGGIVGGLAGFVLTYLSAWGDGRSLNPAFVTGGVTPGRARVGRFEIFTDSGGGDGT